MLEKDQIKEGEPRVIDFVDEFAAALRVNLLAREQEWGNTWLYRSKEGQEERSWENLRNWYDQFRNASVSIPQLDIAGDALICWIREQHPEIEAKYL
jgi:hypothetical protein